MLEIDRNEEWRPVVGHESLYSVSNTGRIRRDRGGRGTSPGTILSPCISVFGYSQVSIAIPLGGRRSRKVHCIVAEAFIGPRKHGMVINHKNGIKTDNRIENLEYCTNSQNIAHFFESGNRSAKHGKKVLSKSDVIEVRRLISIGLPQSTIAKKFGIDRRSVSYHARKHAKAAIPAFQDGTR